MTCDNAVAPAVTKSLGVKTLSLVCLILFLAFAEVTTEEPLSTSSFRRVSLTKCDDTLCIDIRVIQESLGTEFNLVPGILYAKNLSLHSNYIHAMFILINQGCSLDHHYLYHP